jgi:hypothetical protein
VNSAHITHNNTLRQFQTDLGGKERQVHFQKAVKYEVSVGFEEEKK